MTDQKPPLPRWLIPAVVIGVVLIFGAIFIVATDTSENPPPPSITGVDE